MDCMETSNCEDYPVGYFLLTPALGIVAVGIYYLNDG